MAGTPGRTRSVSCEYARLSPEVTLQYKKHNQRGYAITHSNTQRNKNTRSLIMNPTPTKRAGVPNRRRTRAATG
ncbi:hypothetical protein GGI42DRAFT_322885 [Trichoderma sp. SZMC 28013]